MVKKLIPLLEKGISILAVAIIVHGILKTALAACKAHENGNSPQVQAEADSSPAA